MVIPRFTKKCVLSSSGSIQHLIIHVVVNLGAAETIDETNVLI
jgi:hypothetical protein